MTPQTTSPDWLRFRVQAEPRDVLEALRPMFEGSGHTLSFGDRQRGILGFQSSLPLRLADIPVARFDFGGESQRGWVRVDVPGKGCEWVQDWAATDLVEALPSAEIRRLDIALTTWNGEVTHDQVVAAHTAGRFVTRGRPPVMQQITSSNPRAGRTCYVGTREKSDRFFRAYEKGFEMVAKYGAGLSGNGVTLIDGKRVEDIYRCELELKAASTDIPWEVIERRDQYFAGAYPFCADILPGIEPDILMRRPEREPQTDLAAALDHLRTQWGPTLFTALHAYGGDMTAVWDKVVGDHHNQVLVDAGVLMVEHE